MAHTITIGTEPDGRPVALKSALDPASIERLADEADRLRAAQHPAVVEVVRFDEVTGVLATAWAPGGPLATADVSLLRGAAALAAAATALVEVHARGITHGRLDATHVLLGPAGQTWLTGFAPPESATATDDTQALGALVRSILDTGGTGATDATGGTGAGGPTSQGTPTRPRSIPPRPSTSRDWRRSLDRLARGTGPRSPNRNGGPLADELRQIAARIADPVHPATDREAARSLREAVERAEARHQRAPSTVPERSSRRPPVRLLVGAGTAVLIAAALAWWWTRPTETTAATTTASPVTTIETSAAPSTTGAAPDDTVAAVRRCVTVAEPAADVDGDGCPEPVTVVDGTVTAGGLTLHLTTERGDLVRLGDWTCQGRTTVAVLRTSGRVEVFDDWATLAQPAVARIVLPEPASEATRPVDLEAPRQPACSAFAVLADGTRRALAVGPGQ